MGQWISDRDGRGIARDIKKKLFSKLDKKWLQSLDNLKSWNVEKGPNFVNCPNFVTIFCRVLKMEKYFLISLSIPRPSRSGIHWPINFTKEIDVPVYWKKKKKKIQVFPGPFSSLQFCIFFFLKIYRIVNFLEKFIGQWIPDRDGRGIARDIKKNYFHFQYATKNGNKVGTI